MPGPRATPDLERPSAPRIYDYLIGGNGSFEPDRQLAGELTAAYPGLRDLARSNRAFVLKAAAWAVRMEGITQFLDLGCGLPVTPGVHDAATSADLDARIRVACVDNNPVVAKFTAAACEGQGGLAAVEADVTEPGKVLADEGLLEVIDLGRPVCAIFGGTLSNMPAEAARAAVAGFTEAMAPGSAVVISCVSYGDRELGERLIRLYGGAGPWRNHRPEDVASFFAVPGLRLIHGRPMDVRCWPACPAEGTAAGDAQVLGGIGIRE